VGLANTREKKKECSSRGRNEQTGRLIEKQKEATVKAGAVYSHCGIMQ